MNTLMIKLAFTKQVLGGFNEENIYEPSAIISLVILLCAVIGLAWALKILSLVRGGLMSKSWQMFGLGFGFLIVAQVLALGQDVQIFAIPHFIVSAIYLLMAIMWLIGLYQTRKVLG